MKRISMCLLALAGLVGLCAVTATELTASAPAQAAMPGMPNMPGMGNMPGMAKPVKSSVGQHLLPWNKVSKLVAQDDTMGKVDKAKKMVTFTGKHIHLVFVAVEPGFPDTTFEVHRLVDPAVRVPAGSKVTLTLVNMDYGPGMIHGIAIGKKSPPYAGVISLPLPQQLGSLALLLPRTGLHIKKSKYWTSTVTFTCRKPGTYYYLCQMPAHAKTGMYGRFIVQK